MTTEYTTMCCPFCGSTYPAKVFHTCTAFKEAVRELAREEIGAHIARTEPIAHYYTVGGNTQPAAQASAFKCPACAVEFRETHECARWGAVQKDCDYLREQNDKQSVYLRECEQRQLAAEKERDELRLRSDAWEKACRDNMAQHVKERDELRSVIDRERLEAQVQRQKLGAANVSISDLNADRNRLLQLLKEEQQAVRDLKEGRNADDREYAALHEKLSAAEKAMDEACREWMKNGPSPTLANMMATYWMHRELGEPTPRKQEEPK